MDTLYKVKTDAFEGPLDLLLDLVEKRKLFVNDVSLSAVTDDFIQFIESHEDFPINESAEFILIASTLMLVKSRSLLPMLELTEEEEASIETLEKRLQEYAEIKLLSEEIRKIFGKKIIFSKTPAKNTRVVFSPDSKTTLSNLMIAMDQVLMSLPKKEMIPKAMVRKIVSLEETIDALAERISKGMRLNFNEFAGHHKGGLTHEKKVMIIVGFLAMLELVKRGAIKVTEMNGDIHMETEFVGVPHYSS